MAYEFRKLLGNRVAVEPIEADKKTAGGIIIPDNIEGEKQTMGVVTHVSPQITSDANIFELVEVGDTILYGQYAGADMEIDGKKIKMLRITDIAAVLDVKD